MDGMINLLQWPAMATTLAAAWLVTSQSSCKRSWGFWCFMVSNVMWITWGWHDRAYGLICLQLGLFALNMRGATKNS